MTKFNYPDRIQCLELKGKQNYGDNFKIVEDDIPIITTLLVFFLNDEIINNLNWHYNNIFIK